MTSDLYQKYLDLAGVMFVVLNEKGDVTLINAKGCEILGYEEKDLIGKNWFDSCLPQYLRSEMREVFQKLMKSQIEPVEYCNNPVLTKSGEERLISWHNTILTDEADKPIGTLSAGLDFTERNKSETALQEGEAKLRAIVETAVDGIITINEQGIIESFNQAAERLFGYSADEMLGKSVNLLMPSPEREEHDRYIQNYLKTGEKKIIGIGREVIGRRKDGTTFPLYIAVGEIKLGERRLFTGIVRDLTEQKFLQQQIIQSERLAIIGKMAAKIAHEVRNPLSSISLNAELLEDEIQSFESVDIKEASSLLKAMISEIDRVTSLTDEYLQFSRMPESHPVKGDLNDLINEMLELLAQEFQQRNIKLVRQGLDGELKLPFDRAQIRRVLLNIVRNAIESMPKGGTLKILTRKSVPVAIIRIQDSGVGIPEEMVANIFNPFFTTKDFGTGLGLAVSQQIIHEHQGRITCQSKVDQGTTFQIELPLDEAK